MGTESPNYCLLVAEPGNMFKLLNMPKSSFWQSFGMVRIVPNEGFAAVLPSLFVSAYEADRQRLPTKLQRTWPSRDTPGPEFTSTAIATLFEQFTSCEAISGPFFGQKHTSHCSRALRNPPYTTATKFSCARTTTSCTDLPCGVSEYYVGFLPFSLEFSRRTNF